MEEARAMIPEFNKVYGYQHYSPGTIPGSTMDKKNRDIAAAAL
jgi:hypothetical protein